MNLNTTKLNNKQLKFLKTKAHSLKPIVMVGNAGLTDAVFTEIDSRIEHHELIKIRLNASSREERLTMVNAICKTAHAFHINSIGHVAVFYRPAAEPIIKLP
jgi:RNA-binding protein